MPRTKAVLEIPAAVTVRGQTTVPAPIRKMLTLGKRDRIIFRGLPDGTVTIAKAVEEESSGDPVMASFLGFLARDMTEQPGRIRPVSPATISRGRALVEGIEVDLESALPEEEA